MKYIIDYEQRKQTYDLKSGELIVHVFKYLGFDTYMCPHGLYFHVLLPKVYFYNVLC